MVRTLRFRATLLVALLGAGSTIAVAETSDFSPHDVFALSDRKNIDDRCQDARKFADGADKSTDSIGPADAVAGAKAFLACARLPNADPNPDPDRQRYLLLSAAAALFLAGTKASGESAERLFKSSDALAAQLGGATPDASLVNVKVSSDSSFTGGRFLDSRYQNEYNAAGQPAAPGPPHSVDVTKRDPLGGARSVPFTDTAGKLRFAAAEELVMRKQSRNPAATTPTAKP